MRNRPRRHHRSAAHPGSAGLLLAQLRNQRRLAVHASQMFMSNVRIVVNLCMSDMFDRYPKLKIVSARAESAGCPSSRNTRVPARRDDHRADEVSYQQRRPSEYFRTTST